MLDNIKDLIHNKNKINACIVSFFMDNIDMKTVQMHQSIVSLFNTKNYPHYIIETDTDHALSIDYFWCINGVTVDSFENENIPKKLNYDVILFIDIDCIPVSEIAIDYFIERAASGRIVGNIQRSNHLDNDKHLFAAPSAIAISRDTFIAIGKPSACRTSRSDICEEYTYAAEKEGFKVELLMPLRFDYPPIKSKKEKDQAPHWKLGEGMPVYGIGTTFGNDDLGGLFYHTFQIRFIGQQERFWEKCQSLLHAKAA